MTPPKAIKTIWKIMGIEPPTDEQIRITRHAALRDIMDKEEGDGIFEEDYSDEDDEEEDEEAEKLWTKKLEKQMLESLRREGNRKLEVGARERVEGSDPTPVPRQILHGYHQMTL